MNRLFKYLSTKYFSIFLWISFMGLYFWLLCYVFQCRSILSCSMEPTLMTNDIVIYKTINKNSIISRGQIITFENSQTNGKLYCKRVIGIEGDTVSFSNGKVYVNNRLLDESAYLDLNINTYSSNSYTVPEHCCFVLGDNRENSFDSRFWEYPYVNYDDITSYYVLTIWSNKWLFWNQKS